MTARESSLSFGPWAKANSHLTSHTYSINYFREFYTKGGVCIFSKGVNIRGKYSFLLFVTAPFPGTNGQFFIKNGEAKYGVPLKFVTETDTGVSAAQAECGGQLRK